MEEIGEQADATPEGEFAATLDRQATISESVQLVGADGRVIEGRPQALVTHAKWFEDKSWRFER